MNKRRNLFVVIILIAACIVGWIAFRLFCQMNKTASSFQEVTQDSSSNGKKITYKGKTYRYNYQLRNVLFLGVDKAEISKEQEAGQGGQTDTILLFSMDSKNKTTTMLEISRDTMAEIKVYDMNGEYLAEDTAQIALQYAYGDGQEKSCRLTRDAVSKILYQVPINAYVSLNMEGVAGIVDALGGVEVEGEVLDGKEAESFVRSRDTSETGSNQERMEHQRTFVKAFMLRLKELAASDEDIYNKLLHEAKDYIVTDLTAQEMERLTEYELEEEVKAVPGEVKAGEHHDEFYTDNEKLQELIINMFYKEV